jgi:hypothetical protein
VHHSFNVKTRRASIDLAKNATVRLEKIAPE